MDLPLTFFYRTPSRYPSGESTETAEISPKKLKLCVLGELSGYITTSTLKRDTIASSIDLFYRITRIY